MLRLGGGRDPKDLGASPDREVVVECRACGHRVRRYAARCPRCGAREPGLSPILDILLPYAVLAAIAALVLWVVL